MALGRFQRFNQWSVRQPVVVAVVLLIGGILAGGLLPAMPVLWIGAIAALILVGFFCGRLPRVAGVGIAAAIFVVGVTAAQLQEFYFSPADIGAFASSSDTLATVELRVDQIPRSPRQWIDARAIAIETRAGPRPVEGELSLIGESPFAGLELGQTLWLTGWLGRPAGPENPGQFDPSAFDRDKRILACLRVKAGAAIDPAGGGPSWLMRLQTGARNLMNDGFDTPAAPDPTFLRALVLGDAAPAITPVRREFDLTGTAWLYSTSGLHIAIIASFVMLLLRLARQGPRRTIWITFFFVLLTVAAVVPSESAIRALLMSAAAMLGLLWRRRAVGLQLLAIAAFTLLVIRPLDLFSPGFQIGAVAVLALILFSGRAAPRLSGRGKVESWNPAARPAHPAAIFLRRAVNFVIRAAVGCTIAWLAVAPLLAYHFQQFSPWTVPCGILLFPLTTVAVIGGVVKIVLSALIPPLAPVWAWSAARPIHWLRDILDVVAGLPGAQIPVPQPPIWAIGGYYLAFFLPLVPWPAVAVRRGIVVAPLAACIALPLVPFSSVAPAQRLGDGSLRLTLLSVGNGQAMVLQLPGGECDLIDCGSAQLSECFQQTIRPCLQCRGIRGIHAVILSNGDFDRSSVAEIEEAFGDPPMFAATDFSSRPHADAADLLGPVLKTHPAILHTAGDQFSLGPARIDVLWPPKNCALDADDSAMVFRLAFAHRTILFTSSIQAAAEKQLLRQPAILKSDVLVAPHRGSADAMTAAFLRAVDARYIVCSCGGSVTRKEQMFDRLAEPIAVHRTSQEGAIDLTIEADGAVGVRAYRN